MRGEFDALRRVALLAGGYLASAEGAVDNATLHELRAALDDLQRRYPYTLEAPSLAGELQALVADGFEALPAPSAADS